MTSEVIKFNPKPHSEYLECKAYFEWTQWKFIISGLVFHIPNEGRRSRVSGSLLKRIGMVAGTPDYFIAKPIGSYGGMFIEMKRSDQRGKKMRENQLECLARLKKSGYYCCVCYGADEAIQETEKYLSGLL